MQRAKRNACKELKVPLHLATAEDNADKALETVQEIYRQFENIQRFPYIGVDLSIRVSFKTDYKYVVWNDYVMLYKAAIEVVEIYRVVNRYQDITKIFS